MKKKLISALAAVVLMGALVGVYFIAQGVGTEEPPPQFIPPHMYDFLPGRFPNAIVGFGITRDDFEVEFSLDDGLWHTVGQYVHIDQQLVRIMADGFVTAVINTRIEAESTAQLAEYGLYPPSATATFHFEDGSAEVIHIGYLTPDFNFHYVRMDGDYSAAYLMRRSSAQRMFLEYNDLIDRRMHMLTPELLVNVELIRQGHDLLYITPNYALGERPGTSVFAAGTSGLEMQSPIRGRNIWQDEFLDLVFAPAMMISLGDLVDLSVDNLARYGLDNPRMTLTFQELSRTQEDGLPLNQWQLLIGNNHNSDFVYASYGGIPHVFLVSEASIIAIENADFFRFTDRFVNLVSLWYIDEIIIEAPGRRYVVETNNTGMGVQEHEFEPYINGQFIQPAAFRSFFQLVLGLTYEVMVEPHLPQGEPVFAVTYTVTDDVPGGPVMQSRFYEHSLNFFSVMQYRSDRGADEYAQFLVARRNVEAVWRYLDALMAGELNRR